MLVNMLGLLTQTDMGAAKDEQSESKSSRRRERRTEQVDGSAQKRRRRRDSSCSEKENLKVRTRTDSKTMRKSSKSCTAGATTDGRESRRSSHSRRSHSKSSQPLAAAVKQQ